MRAAAGLDADDPVGGKRAAPDEELGVLVRVDVVGDDRQVEPVRSRQAQRLDQGGLAGADRAADSDLQGRRDHDRKSRASSRAWRQPAISSPGVKLHRSSASAAGRLGGQTARSAVACAASARWPSSCPSGSEPQRGGTVSAAGGVEVRGGRRSPARRRRGRTTAPNTTGWWPAVPRSATARASARHEAGRRRSRRRPARPGAPICRLASRTRRRTSPRRASRRARGSRIELAGGRMASSDRGGDRVGRPSASLEMGREDRLEPVTVAEQPGLGVGLEAERVGEAAGREEPVRELQEAEEASAVCVPMADANRGEDGCARAATTRPAGPRSCVIAGSSGTSSRVPVEGEREVAVPDLERDAKRLGRRPRGDGKDGLVGGLDLRRTRRPPRGGCSPGASVVPVGRAERQLPPRPRSDPAPAPAARLGGEAEDVAARGRRARPRWPRRAIP